MSAILLRSSEELTTNGRTLEGLAFRWDHPSRVKDPGTPSYLEEFARGSSDKTLRERRDPWPLFRNHDYSRDPLGPVTFEPAAEGLMFRAPLSKTREADETLELVNDGAMRSVSIGFRAYASKKRSSPDGIVTTRTEIALRELSLAPTGFGQHDGAEVLAVRSEGEEAPRLLAVRRRLILLGAMP